MGAYMRLALRLAVKSNHPKYKMASVVVMGGRVVAHATNHHTWGKHCEIRSLKRCGDADGATVYVARVGGKMSKPCPMCQKLLKEYNVKCAVYMDKDGQMAHMNF